MKKILTILLIVGVYTISNAQTWEWSTAQSGANASTPLSRSGGLAISYNTVTYPKGNFTLSLSNSFLDLSSNIYCGGSEARIDQSGLRVNVNSCGGSSGVTFTSLGALALTNTAAAQTLITVNNAGKTNFTVSSSGFVVANTIRAAGPIVIGNPTSLPTGYKMYVTGGILTEAITIASQGSTIWPDYVFEKTYSLPSLSTVESYINEHKHLPEIPSANDMVANGLDVEKMHALLLKKVEELMLYTIDLQKDNNALAQKINSLK